MDTAVMKIGGSLAQHPQELRALCTNLSDEAKRYRFLLVPGGGEFADAVRKIDKRFGLSFELSHRMAILAMDQYGLLLADLTPNSKVISSLTNVQSAWNAGLLPILLPSQHFLVEDPLENSWDVTSDSIAAYIAGKLGIDKLVLVTDVDGVFNVDPKKDSKAKLIDFISAKELSNLAERTSVDRFLPRLLIDLHLDCFVVNGLFPERVEAVLDGKETICTRISG